jgi:hypothetical protein
MTLICFSEEFLSPNVSQNYFPKEEATEGLAVCNYYLFNHPAVLPPTLDSFTDFLYSLPV